MRWRPLGNHTDKAWLAGWDAGVIGYSVTKNPYRRSPQVKAWDDGWTRGRRSNDDDVRVLKRHLEKRSSLNSKYAKAGEYGRANSSV